MHDLDLYLFKLINGVLYRRSLDPIFRFLSNWEKIQPLAALAVVVVFFCCSRRWKYLLALLGLSIALADTLATDLKYAAHRTRPYIAMPEEVRHAEKYEYHSTSYSMPSNHAANLFAAAFFAALFLKRRWLAALFFVPALLVGYSRIYLGVHYPSDVLAGYGIGALAAGSVALLHRYWPVLTFDENDRVKTFDWCGLTVLLFCFGTVYRFSVIGRGEVPLFPEEARYWDMSQTWNWSQPSILAVLIGFSTHVLGRTVFAVRVVGVTLGIGAVIFGTLFTLRKYGSTLAGFVILLALFAIPVFSGCGLFTLNASLLLFGSAGAIFFMARPLPARSCWTWVGASICVLLCLSAIWDFCIDVRRPDSRAWVLCPTPAIFFFAIACSGWLARFLSSNAPRSRKWVVVGVTIIGLAPAVAYSYFIHEAPAFPRTITALARHGIVVKPEYDPLYAAFGYDRMAKWAADVVAKMPHPERTFVLSVPTDVSELTFYMKDGPRVFPVEQSPATFKKWDAVYVFKGHGDDILDPAIAARFRSVENAERRRALNQNVPYTDFTIYRCYGFQGSPAP